MTQTVVGVFDSSRNAQQAISELVRSGYREDDVQLQAHPASMDGDDTRSYQRDIDPDTGTGFTTSVSRFFRNLFGDEDEHAGHYSEAVRRGGAVVSVTVPDDSDVERARSALAEAGAVDIEKRAETWRQDGYDGFREDAEPYTPQQIASERERVLPVIREELEVGKREVDLGAVRVHSRIVETPVNQTVELREQHASVERRPVDRAVTSADMNAFKEGSIEVRETAERAVVSKTARVVEEVVVGTSSTSNTETINETVRNTEVDIEKTGENKARGMQGAGMDDTDVRYRTHFDTNYADAGGRYEEYQPAYRYGAELRSDARYANRSWDDVEADARADWGSSYPDSTWERMKTAVRHGWESMTGQR